MRLLHTSIPDGRTPVDRDPPAHQSRGFLWISSFVRDLAHAYRTLRSHPGYTAVAVLSLALGIGANTAVYSLLDAYVFRPLPYPDPGRLVLIYESGLMGGRFRSGAVAAPVLRDWKELSRAFASMGAYQAGSVNLADAGGAVRVAATRIEPDVFKAVAVSPSLGQTFRPEHANEGQDRVVILSHGLWQDRFAGAQDVLGKTLRIDAADHVVIGVMPAGFEFPPRMSTALWVPLPLTTYTDRGLKLWSVVARVKPNLSLGAARQDLANVSRRIREVHPNSRQALVRPLHEETVVRTALVAIVLGGTVAFVLLLACANVSHMVLARANARRHEFAVRLAMGASRLCIMRLLLAEGLLLAGGGGLLGLVTCRWALDALLAVPDNPLPAGVDVEVNWAVLTYCAVVSVATAVAVSLVPALRMSRQTLQTDLQETMPSARRRARYGNGLITAEVALSVVLVIGAGMLLRSLHGLADLDLGFQPDHVLTMRLSLPPRGFPDAPRVHAFHDRLLERVAALPGVVAAGMNNLLPVQMTYTNMDFTVEGRTEDRPGYEPFAEHRTVSPGFFEALRIPVVSGRALTEADNRRGSGVLVISEAAAAEYWPGVDPVGKRIAYGTRPVPDRWLTIVGVVGDIRSAGLGRPPQVILYAPYRDFDYPIQSVSLVVRTAGPPAAVAPAIRQAVRVLNQDVALHWMSTMDEVIARAAAGTRFLSALLTTFSALAVVLAVVGVYGVMSYVVTQRRRDVGVRMAVGASRGQVIFSILKHGARRALIGTGLGLVWAVSLGVTMRPFLIGIGPVDVLTDLAAAAGVMAVALAASAIPAYRASRVNPAEALRHE